LNSKPSIEDFNALSLKEAEAILFKALSSRRWVESLLAARPFESVQALYAEASRKAKDLNRSDWLEAFSQHPKLGDLEALKKKFGAAADLSQKEQAGLQEADEEILKELAKENQNYENRFSYIFILSAAGKTAGEILEALKKRIKNAPEEELQIAAAEQMKITLLRLGAFFS